MKAASQPRAEPNCERLLVLDPEAQAFADFAITDLPAFLGPGDALIVNDAATLPASLRAAEDLELRLLSRLDDGSWLALTFGRGDFREPTEMRGQPPRVGEGERLDFGRELSARVLSVDPASPRVLCIRFEQEESELWQALYRAARPIQYAYVERPLSLWDVQNGYGARPWAFELPSAGKPLSFETLFRIEARGVSLLHLTHAAGVSSTGDPLLDARLPLAERYEIGEATAHVVNQTRARGGRVVAVGTSVTRALEAASLSGSVRAGSERTALLLGPGSRLRVCDGLLTGMHEPGTSHYALLEAFAPRPLLDQSFRHAERLGYLQHEFGDSCLILGGSLAGVRRARDAAA
ncbi:MAG TPA: S-adenosylmethionine:tRNA ribosyltransferase-isomerase [Polyangiaceae bacterium]|nr:S-adenosylmethionine:tRNA ribosyltransferase-isomerase [Polyangiaceae bacterium]